MSSLVVRVAIDLDGSLEPMGDTMNELSTALMERGVDLVPFASARGEHRIDKFHRRFVLHSWFPWTICAR